VSNQRIVNIDVGDGQMQLIFCEAFTNAHDVLKSFDLSCCMVGLTGRESNGAYTIITCDKTTLWPTSNVYNLKTLPDFNIGDMSEDEIRERPHLLNIALFVATNSAKRVLKYIRRGMVVRCSNLETSHLQDVFISTYVDANYGDEGLVQEFGDRFPGYTRDDILNWPV
jgi:hypothetical protein